MIVVARWRRMPDNGSCQGGTEPAGETGDGKMDAATMIRVLDLMIEAKVLDGLQNGCSREQMQTIVALQAQRAYWAAA
jgi:hypothetical protein